MKLEGRNLFRWERAEVLENSIRVGGWRNVWLEGERGRRREEGG